MSKEHFQDNTYSLLKGMGHIQQAMNYFDDVKLGYHAGVKEIINQYSLKCKWILDNIRHRIPTELLKEVDKDLEDSLVFDSIKDYLILMNPEQRLIVENIAKQMSKGEEIKIAETNKVLY